MIAFFLVEMGDKTQLATIALAARYDSLVLVVMGTTLGMMIANVPAVWIGGTLAERINMKVMRWVAAALFVILGVLTLVAPLHCRILINKALSALTPSPSVCHPRLKLPFTFRFDFIFGSSGDDAYYFLKIVRN